LGISGSNVNTARRAGAAGKVGTSQDAGLMFGGIGATTVANVESYDGSSWTEVADLNEVKHNLAGLGTQTAALAVGGEGSPAFLATNESWNGSAWTELGDINEGRREFPGAGTTTAGLVIGGNDGSSVASVESWNGSSWTEVNDLNTARKNQGACGTQAAAICFAGGPPEFCINRKMGWNKLDRS
jgi:hypothetical protein